MQKYQIVSKWDGENPLQILEISTSKPAWSFSSTKFIFIIWLAILGYVFFGGAISSFLTEKKEENLQVPAPITDMKSNPHAAEDLSSLGDL